MDLAEKLSMPLDSHPTDGENASATADTLTTNTTSAAVDTNNTGVVGGGKIGRSRPDRSMNRAAPYRGRGGYRGGRGGYGGRGHFGYGGRGGGYGYGGRGRGGYGYTGRGGFGGRGGGYHYRRGRGSGLATGKPETSTYGKMTVADIAKAPPEQRILKVSSHSNVSKVAGSIAFVCRAGEAPTVLATGYDPCNQALKALCLAGKYLEESNVELRVVPHFQGDTASVRLQLTKVPRGQVTIDPTQVELLTVLEHTIPQKTAGAIANRVRQGTRCALHSNGRGVFRALEAIAFARRYLQDDAKDICFEPTMVTVTTQRGQRCVKVCRKPIRPICPYI